MISSTFMLYLVLNKIRTNVLMSGYELLHLVSTSFVYLYNFRKTGELTPLGKVQVLAVFYISSISHTDSIIHL